MYFVLSGIPLCILIHGRDFLFSVIGDRVDSLFCEPAWFCSAHPRQSWGAAAVKAKADLLSQLGNC